MRSGQLPDAVRRGGRWLLLALSLGLAHVAHERADAARDAESDVQMRIVPSPQSLRAAAMGQPTLLADLMWIRAVLQFIDVYEHPDALGIEWLGQMVRSVVALDPTWRSAPFYGGSFLRLVGDVDSSDEIYRQAHAQLPDDPHFPFALGMNAYLVRDDTAAAARWIQIAADTPGAPGWYKAAAAAFIGEQGQRRTAIRYLREELEQATKPGVRKALQTKLDELTHAEWVELIAQRREKLAAERGRDIARIEELGELPPDPYGAGWILAPDGVVRSAQVDARLAKKQQRTARALLLKPAYR